MEVQFGRKLLLASGLLIVIVLLTPGRAGGQRPTGSLTGTLTDTHSAPLEHVTLTLRNVTTGFAASAVTSHGGRYGFQGLSEGEYTLSASGPAGSGQVGGILVSPGHMSRVQTVIDFAAPHGPGSEPSIGTTEIGLSDSSLQSTRREFLTRIANQSGVRPESAVLEASLPVESLTVLTPISSKRSPAHFAPALSASSVPVLRASMVAVVEPVGFAVLEDSLLIARVRWKSQILADQLDITQSASEELDEGQVQSPPGAADWTISLGDARPSSDEADQDRGRSRSVSPHTNVDNLRLGSAFGVLHRGRGEHFATGESAIRLLGRGGPDGLSISEPGHAYLEIETKRGTDHLHGQVFLFNRHKLFAAQNPFTQWVKETTPASASRIAGFTSLPYTPADLELQWGAGASGALHRSHLFWFGAVDGYRRSDPALAAVRHPDRFFAQPANDQMQLLSAQLGLSSVDPVSEGGTAYSKLLESLAGLLGPAPRSSLQLSGFGRLDWSAGDRHRFTFEGNGRRSNSPGGGFTRAWQAYGAHSLGSANLLNGWLLGRWSASVSPDLLTVTQGSFSRHVLNAEPASPSVFEQSLNISAWGHLPQIVVDSRDGFTIGNPARFGKGRYPDENVYSLQQQVKWVHGKFLFDLGGELNHEMDATSRLRNQTGTYYYSSIGDFASDALAFFAFGVSGQLNPMDQHNCDQRGKPWRDTGGVLHGLGYLPCYAYYSQTIGPSEWWLSTNDWAGYITARWQPSRTTVITLSGRWELEQLPPPIGRLDNPDLPLTQRLPSLGSQWSPRAGIAWGTEDRHWPVLRLGYGVYFSRTPNAAIETALTQTGSIKGDLNFFLRPTDNLREGGAPPFPYVLTGEPGNVVKPGAVEFAPSFRNGELHHAEMSIEETLPGRVHLEASAVAGLGRKLPVTIDANIDATNPKTITYAVVDRNRSGPIKAPQITIPFFASWPSAGASSGVVGRVNPMYQQVSETFSRANSTYEAMLVRLSRNARGLSFRTRYTFGHTADWNPDESLQTGGPSVLDPNDFRQEYGTSDLDVRHSLTSSVILQPRWKLNRGMGYLANGWMLSGSGRFDSGSPFTMRTSGSIPKEFTVNGQMIVGLSTGMNGYGGDNRIYGIGRNTYRYPATWKADLRISKRFNLGQMRELELMAESFNFFNHQNVTQIETVGYSIEQGTLNGAMPRLSFLTGLKSGQAEFGKPLDINATDSYHPRQFQFGARMRF